MPDTFTAILKRDPSTDEGTHGILTVMNTASNAELVLQTIELPWKDNAHNVSCIPTGQYTCKYTATGKTIGGENHWYLLSDTGPRAGILMHIGNFAGDVSNGYRTDSEGCILLGMSRGKLSVGEHGIQDAVLSSTAACHALIAFTGKADITLDIQ